MAKALWNGVVIAESDDTIVVENNHYFPIDSIKADYLRDSSHQSSCPWKGQASYYSLEVDGARNENAAWYYRSPKDAATAVTGRVAFWKGVTVTV